MIYCIDSAINEAFLFAVNGTDSRSFSCQFSDETSDLVLESFPSHIAQFPASYINISLSITDCIL